METLLAGVIVLVTLTSDVEDLELVLHLRYLICFLLYLLECFIVSHI